MATLFSQIRPEERRTTYGAIATLFGIMCGHAALETAREALFLGRVPASQLAFVYIAIAVVCLTIFLVQRRSAQRQGKSAGLGAWLLASAAVTLLFWLLTAQPAIWVLYALYIWCGVFATLVVVRFWTMLGDLFDVSQAKRLFPAVGVGGVLGAMVGSGLAGILDARLEARQILLASALILVATALGAVGRLPTARAAEETQGAKPPTVADSLAADLGRAIQVIHASPFLRRTAVIAVVSTITFTLIDFLFKSSMAAAIPADQLGTYFGASYFAFNLLSLLAQFFVVGWLIRTFGISQLLALLPCMLLLGAGGVAIGGGLFAILALKGIDGSMRHSLHRTTSEVLWVPLSGELRSRVKGLVDVVGQRGGQAIAAVMFLGIAALDIPLRILALVIMVLAGTWASIAITLRKHYLDLFRQALSEVAIARRLDYPELDLASLETLLTTLNSTHEGEVVAAIELLSEQDRVRLLPALILYHPSSRVVLRALELFRESGRRDCLPIIDHLLHHDNAEVRAATLRALATLDPQSAVPDTFLSDPSPAVRTAALVAVNDRGGEGGGRRRQKQSQRSPSRAATKRSSPSCGRWDRPAAVKKRRFSSSWPRASSQMCGGKWCEPWHAQQIPASFPPSSKPSPTVA